MRGISLRGGVEKRGEKTRVAHLRMQKFGWNEN